MTMLGNEFATLMLASGTGDDVAGKLSDACRRLEWERNLTIFIRPLDSVPPTMAGLTDTTHRLTAEGVDKAGIVAAVSRTLAERGVDIVDLRSGMVAVPQSGTPLYTLTIRMRVPSTLEIEDLDTRLADVAERLDIEITLEPDLH